VFLYTGKIRSTSEMLNHQNERTSTDDSETLENLSRTKALGERARDFLVTGRLDDFALDKVNHWANKRRRYAGRSGSHIDSL
jgi:galactokinase/mevalonate kinase-like predicted kinase